MMRALEWEDGRPLNDEAIRAVEERLGVRLPQEFVECVRHHDGGTPEPCHFDYPDPDLGAVETSVGCFLSLDLTHKGNVLDVVGWVADQLPAQVVPFADEPGGDLVCFDYRGGSTPTVVYWMHEREGEDAIVPLAPTFATFLDRLRNRAA